MARLDARWLNFTARGQAWDHFWQDGPATTAGAYSLACAAGVYNLTGYAAGFQRSRVMPAVSGVYNLTGFAATLTYAAGKSLTVDAGVYNLTGFAASLVRGLPATTGTYNLTGFAAAFERSRVMAAAAGVYNLTGFAATLTYSGSAPPPATSDNIIIRYRRRGRR